MPATSDPISRHAHPPRRCTITIDHEDAVTNEIFCEQVEAQEKPKVPKGRALKRLKYTRRFVNVTLTGGKRKVRTSPPSRLITGRALYTASDELTGSIDEPQPRLISYSTVGWGRNSWRWMKLWMTDKDGTALRLHFCSSKGGCIERVDRNAERPSIGGGREEARRLQSASGVFRAPENTQTIRTRTYVYSFGRQLISECALSMCPRLRGTQELRNHGSTQLHC
ncbi:ribosomal protein s30 domain-containing protein [Sarocladium implicatum]|nr:ribosomal protein s30 domain-containing protein [Sarocladium implicatum]